MKILVLITARGGSKRLPGKNIRLLGGKPLIAWSIEIARDLPGICDILVSTDSREIASVAQDFGAYVPWLRPAYLATDEANSIDVTLHALDRYEAEKGGVDGILLLQPTSPFRSHNVLRRGIEQFVSSNYETVVGVSPVAAHPLWMFSIENGHLNPIMHKQGLGARSQDLPPVYVINGSFYLISPKHLRMHRSFFEPSPLPLVMESPEEIIDIDSLSDFRLAEYMASNL